MQWRDRVDSVLAKVWVYPFGDVTQRKYIKLHQPHCHSNAVIILQNVIHISPFNIVELLRENCL